jgi:hypothetical protein
MQLDNNNDQHFLRKSCTVHHRFNFISLCFSASLTLFIISSISFHCVSQQIFRYDCQKIQPPPFVIVFFNKYIIIPIILTKMSPFFLFQK